MLLAETQIGIWGPTALIGTALVALYVLYAKDLMARRKKVKNGECNDGNCSTGAGFVTTGVCNGVQKLMFEKLGGVKQEITHVREIIERGERATIERHNNLTERIERGEKATIERHNVLTKRIDNLDSQMRSVKTLIKNGSK